MERDFLSMGVPVISLSYYVIITQHLDNKYTTLVIPNVFWLQM